MRFLLTLCVTVFALVSFTVNASAQQASKTKPATQEAMDEQELEAHYGVDVERDRLNRGSVQTTTRDRYGDGRVAVFQDNTKSARNLETNDTIGFELRLFEFK